MTLVPRLQDLLQRPWFRGLAHLAYSFDRLTDSLPIYIRRGYQMGHRLSVARDDDHLATLHCVEILRKTRFCF